MTKKMTPERRRILETLEKAGEPMSPLAVAGALDRTQGSTRELLAQMARSGLIVTTGRGHYALPQSSTSGQADSGPDEPDVLPDEPDDTADEPDDSHQSLIDQPDHPPNPTGMWIFSQADGGAIPLSLHRKRKGYA
jgi:hypothetical protein